MNNQIDNFIAKWNDMLAAATEIEGFKYKFAITVTTDTSLDNERAKLMDGVNRAFNDNGMKYKSSSSN